MDAGNSTSKAEKKESIHHSNDILIGKMMDVQASVPLHTTEVRRRPSSLSRSYRKRVEREIDLGNEVQQEPTVDDHKEVAGNRVMLSGGANPKGN